MEDENNQKVSNKIDLNFDNKMLIIVALCIILFFSLLGVNLFFFFGGIFETVAKFVMPLFRQILSLLGFSAGTIINKTADVVGDTAKFSVDIAEGTVQSVGTLLQKASAGGLTDDMRRNFKDSMNITPSSYENSVLSTAASKRSSWCLVGEYQGKRGCVEINEGDKCLSKQIYPNKQMCLNPTQTNNMQQVNKAAARNQQ